MTKRSQAGNISMATVVFTLAATVALLIGSMVVSYVMATHRARAAADLTALTAATSATRMLDEGQSCQEASRIAQDNGAQLTGCEIVRAGDEVAAKVEVSVGLHWTLPGLPDQVSSVSFAGNPS